MQSLVSSFLSVYSALGLAHTCPPIDYVSLDVRQIVRLIRDPECAIKSVSDTLAHLPRELSAYQMLFYRSRSLQGPHAIDYLNPRAIIFRNDQIYVDNVARKIAPFILSFNGHPEQPGYKSLEMVEIHTETPDDVFRYYEINYPLNDDQALNANWRAVQQGIQVSGPNPPRCVACHGSPARPIMSSYPIWEGAFGSTHGSPMDPAEEKGLIAYAQKVRGTEKSRYQLIQDPAGYDIAGGLDTLEFKRDTDNGQLNAVLANANAVRMAALIQKTPDYARFRYALAAALSDCGNIESFIPKPVIQRLLQNIESRFQLRSRWQDQNIRAMYRRIFEAKSLFVLQELVEVNGSKISYDEFVRRLKSKIAVDAEFERLQLDTLYIQGLPRGDLTEGKLRLLTEGRGIAIGNWFMDLSQPTYRYLDGGGPPFETAKSLAASDPAFDPGLKKAFTYQYSTGSRVGVDDSARKRADQAVRKYRCERLAQLSLATLNEFVPELIAVQSSSAEDAAYPAVFRNTCATCHDPVVGEPLCTSIPFRTPSMMANWISNADNVAKIQGRVLSSNEETRMPPTRLLNDAELNAVVKYIGSH